MLSIKLPDLNRSIHGPLYIGTVKRLANATAIKFIDDTHLCAINLVGMYMQLYEFNYNKKTSKLIDQIDTIYDNKLCVIDLMDYDNLKLFVTSNFDVGTQTIYKLENNKLSFYKNVCKFSIEPQYCHGVKFYPFNKNILCFTFNRHFVFNVNFVDYINNKMLYQIEYLQNYNPKDMAFINKNEMLIIYSASNVTPDMKQSNYESRIVYLKFNLENKTHNIIDFCDIPHCHSDCIIFRKNVIFINNQTDDCVITYYLNKNKMHLIESIKIYDKPHGLDISHNNKLLGVADYGDNTIKIIEIPQTILSFMEA